MMAIVGFCFLIVVGLWLMATSFGFWALSAMDEFTGIMDYVMIILPSLIGIVLISIAFDNNPFYFGVN